MFTAMQIILILLWFTGYDVYSKLFGGFTAGGCVLHGVVSARSWETWRLAYLSAVLMS